MHTFNSISPFDDVKDLQTASKIREIEKSNLPLLSPFASFSAGCAAIFYLSLM